MRKNILAILIFFLSFTSVMADEAEDAYNRGDYATAARLFEPRAEAGESFAQVFLGFMYEKGLHLTKDEVQAVYWYRKAAEQGNSTGQKNLGVMYDDGRGVAQNSERAVYWYRKAVEQDNSDAQINLGYMYEKGRGVPHDDAQAAYWYRKAAEQGHALGQNNLGSMYQNGAGVTQNDVQAVDWFKKGAEQGNSQAQNNLGYMYNHGRGVPQDDAQSVYWYRKAAEQGNSQAQNNLGYMYDHGRGVPQDYAQAAYWYRKAAEQGNSDAQVSLGFKYENGQGVTQDHEWAVYWYRKAAEQADSQGQSNLGTMYRDGLGVPQDDAQAVSWYKKAAAQGNSLGQTNLGYMYDKGRGVTQDYGQAVVWYRKAAEQGEPYGQKNLGVMYETGRGTEQDNEQAVRWYKKSAEQGNSEAATNLQVILTELGMDPGPQDGVYGEKTRLAAERFLDSTGSSDIAWKPAPLLGEKLHEQPVYRSPSPLPVPESRAHTYGELDFGNFYALVIGNKQYTHLDDLNTAVKDARAVADLLKSQYGFRVRKLENATESQIIEALWQYRQDLSARDNLLIYYAGHGTIDSRTKRGYWQPVDARPNNPSNWIAVDDITNTLHGMAAWHVLVIADSCYSGTLLRSSGRRGTLRTESREEWVRRMNERKSRTALTSGGNEPVLDGGGSGHSVFAMSLLKTLRENREIVDIDYLFDDIKDRVTVNARQTPGYDPIRFTEHDFGDFILVPR